MCWCVFGPVCGMTMRSAAAWAGLLQSRTALREVNFGGAAVAECFAAVRSEVTCGLGWCAVCTGMTMGDDEVTTLADAARAHYQLTSLGFNGQFRAVDMPCVCLG